MATAGDRRGTGPERAFAETLPARGEVVLTAEESHHLVRVRRAAPGDAVVLFDGRGATRLGRLVAADARAARVEVLGPHPDREPARAVTLLVSLPEGGRADDLVATLAEIGVATFRPLVTARTPPRRAGLTARRRARWERLAREAAKVNGRSRLLLVGDETDLATALAEAPAAILLDPDPSAPWLLSSLRESPTVPWLLVGPEGGFTEEEVASARAAGARTARVAGTALRTETAAVVAAAQALGGS